MEIITGAIERYKELAEGNYNGECLNRCCVELDVF